MTAVRDQKSDVSDPRIQTADQVLDAIAVQTKLDAIARATDAILDLHSMGVRPGLMREMLNDLRSVRFAIESANDPLSGSM